MVTEMLDMEDQTRAGPCLPGCCRYVRFLYGGSDETKVTAGPRPLGHLYSEGHLPGCVAVGLVQMTSGCVGC